MEPEEFEKQETENYKVELQEKLLDQMQQINVKFDKMLLALKTLLDKMG